MTPSPAAVTAHGVRDGERGALAALVERRGAAVLAYCDHLAAPDRALEAAGEAFAAFRREVRAAEDPVALDPEAMLRQATRRAAAVRAPRPAAPAGLLRRRRAATCQFVPELLAALRAAAPNADERAAPAEVVGAESNGASATSAAVAAEDDAPAEPAGPPTLSWDPAELLAAAKAAEQHRDWGALTARIVVPAVVAVVAGVLALIVAGAFSGGDTTDSTTSTQPRGVLPPTTVRVLQRPATTPLPPSTSSSSSTSSASAPAPAPRAAQRVSSSDASSSSSSRQPVRAVVQAPARERPTATVDAAGTGGTEAAPPTNGGAPASGQAGFTPSP